MVTRAIRTTGVAALLSLSTAALSVTEVSAQDYLDQETIDAMRRGVDVAASDFGFSGTVLVGRRDSLILLEARGHASLELDVPMRRDQRLLLASVSKSFTAAAVLRLVDAGWLDLDATALGLLPQSGIDPRITIRQLLTHSSGLARDLLPGTGRTRKEAFDTPTRVSLAIGHGLRFPPGSRYAYSSPGYVVLGAVIERITGAELPDALDSLVFAPLGMTATGLERDPALILRRANRYRRDSLGVLPGPYEHPSFAYGSGSVSGTAEDLWRFGRALLAPGFLSETSLTMMTSDQFAGQGFGLRPYTYTVGPRAGGGRGRGVGYDGGTSGVASIYNVLLDHDIVVIVLANVTPFAANRLSNYLINLALGHELPAGGP